MKISIAQLNPTVGDIEENLKKMVDALEQGNREGSDLVVLPELFLPGYPPRDLLERSWFIEQNQQALQKMLNISAAFPSTGILFGVPLESTNPGRGLYNSAVLIYRGEILASQHKSLLPIYDVFDEARYFDPAPEIHTVVFKGETLGISICEDAWNDPELWHQRRIYNFDPIEALAQKGASLLLNIAASPFHSGKEAIRYRLICKHARKHGLPFFYVNQVGANDELVFDGRSMFIDSMGQPALICPAFREYLTTVDTSLPAAAGTYAPLDKIESVYQALLLGIKDYMHKCGFTKAVLGLSGGIDSALVACLAADAIGAENVLAVAMPSPFSSKSSLVDAKKLAANLGIQFSVVEISSIYDSYLKSLERELKGKHPDLTEENIQARIRGNILMAFSNKFAYLLLSTGNKSEMAVGYCTLYGDMSGGLSVLSDVPKTMVYELAAYINRNSEIIPCEIITKPPSAELKPGQVDQDELPPYDVLDKILYYYIEEGYAPKQLIDLGLDAETIKWVIQAVDGNEYKRRQAAPGIKVTSKAFGIGRRMPVASRIQHF